VESRCAGAPDIWIPRAGRRCCVEAAMQRHDLSNRRQAQTVTRSFHFGGEERLEDPGETVWLDARTTVSHREQRDGFASGAAEHGRRAFETHRDP
jgi:hypothetical protein